MITLWRYAKAQLHWSWVLQPLWLAAMLGWLFFNHQIPTRREVWQLYPIFEYYLPLALAIYLAGAPPFDREQGAAEIQLGAPQWPVLRLALLALPRLAAWALTLAAALLVTRVWYLPGYTWTLLKVTGAPSLALAGAALAGSALARHQTGGILAGFAWWVVDAFGGGRVGQKFFLFRISVHTGLYAPEVQTRNIALLGAACLLLCLWVSHRRAYWIR